MRTSRLLAAILAALAMPAAAHDEPTSNIDIRLSAVEMKVEITASATDIAHDLPDIEPRMLLDEKTLSEKGQQLGKTIASRMKIEGDGETMDLPLRSITPLPEKRDLVMVFSRDWRAAPANLRLEADLFPYDPRHSTFVNVHSGGETLRQFVLTADQPVVSFATTGHQGLGATAVTFIKEGVHHIFIGPDHILFIVALMLLGGGLQRMLMIITAFTVAHSITLALATFRILSPPAGIIEPVIALSIVVVGIHAFVGSSRRDPRLLFAFCFGLIHGFGFANVLQEMVLPREALALSLFAFNFGVEIGQALILLAVAPMLSLFRMAYPLPGKMVVSAGALAVTCMGAFWFFQRIGG
jgi:hydrogenase/urease accessory protein HupE